MEINLSKQSLYRIEKNQWRFLNASQEIYIEAQNFELAQYVACLVENLHFDYKKPFYFRTQKQQKVQYWVVSSNSLKWYNPRQWVKSLKKTWPFTRKYPNTEIINLTLNSKFSFFKSKKKYSTHLKVPTNLFSFPAFKLNPQAPLDELLNEAPYNDAFTKIASFYFQEVDPSFTPSHKLNSSHYILYSDGQLILQPLKKSFSDQEKSQNRNTLNLFLDNVEKRVGDEKLRIILYRFQINFEEMIEKGLPLLPEHVYRVNIGTNNLELEDVERVYNKFISLFASDNLAIFNTPHVFELLFENFDFTLRELKQLKKHFKKSEDLSFIQTLLKSIEKASAVKDLPKETLNFLIDLLCTPKEHFDLIFTGRKIIHKAISGYYTVGKRKKFKPWLDLAELLQVFQSLRHFTNIEHYYELLSHVVVKKHMIRRHPDLKWSLGALIPAPSKNEEKRWYYVDSWLDDNHGDFNYTLLPACSSYQDMPAIKLYRSTTLDHYQMFHINSVLADMSIHNAPGAGKRESADYYELPFFLKRTIPLWVGYYLLAVDHYKNILLVENLNEKKETIEKSLQYLNTAVEHLPPSLPKIEKANLKSESLHDDFQKLKQKLFNLAHQTQELPEYKVFEDIAYVGHSLGGSLSQGGLYHFGSFYKRIPLLNKKYTCYAGDPPGITKKEYSYFWQFVQKHSKLISHLNEKWEILTQFEWGDVISQSGASHLGGIKDLSVPFMKLKSFIFKPLKTAKAKEITTLPTHGRRIGNATLGLDYNIFLLTPKELYEYSQAFYLNKKQKDKFGFRFFRSPKTLEGARRALSKLSSPFHYITKKVFHKLLSPRGNELRDSDGNAFLMYKSSLIDKTRLETENKESIEIKS